MAAHLTRINPTQCACRRPGGDPVRRRRDPADGAGVQHQLVRRLLRAHGRFAGHEPLHGAPHPGHAPLPRRRLDSGAPAAGPHARVPHAGPRPLHRPAAALPPRPPHGLLPRRRSSCSRSHRRRCRTVLVCPGCSSVVAAASLLAPSSSSSPSPHLAPASHDPAGPAWPAGAGDEAQAGGRADPHSAANDPRRLRLHLRVPLSYLILLLQRNQHS